MKLHALAAAVVLTLLGCGSRGALLDDGDDGAGGDGGAAQGAGGAGSSTSDTGVTATGTTGSTGAAGGNPTSGQSGSTTTSTGSGPGTGSVTASSTATGGEICPGFGDPCTECASIECADRYCNCFNNQECLDLFACTNACNGDEACNQACLTSHEAGISDALGLSDCAATTCSGSCKFGDELEPCAECLVVDCEDAMNACLAEPECLMLFNCISGCPQLDLACQQACYDDHGAGVPTLQDLLMCSQSACDDVCN